MSRQLALRKADCCTGVSELSPRTAPITPVSTATPLIRDPLRQCRPGMDGAQLTTNIAGDLLGCGRLFDRALNGLGACAISLRLRARAIPGQQLRGGENERERIGDVLTRNIGRRSMRGLRHGIVLAQIE